MALGRFFIFVGGFSQDLLRAGGWDDGEFGDLPGGRREREARRAEAPEKVRATADTMAQPDAETGEDQEYQEFWKRTALHGSA